MKLEKNDWLFHHFNTTTTLTFSSTDILSNISTHKTSTTMLGTKALVVALLLIGTSVVSNCSFLENESEGNIYNNIGITSRGSKHNSGLGAGNFFFDEGFSSKGSENSRTNSNGCRNRRAPSGKLYDPFSFGLGFLSNSRNFSDVNFPFNLNFSESGMDDIQDELNQIFSRRFAVNESRRIRDGVRGLSLSTLRDSDFDPVSFGLGFSTNFNFSEGSNLTEIFAGRTMRDMKASFRTQFGTSIGNLKFKGFKRGFSKFRRGGRFGFQNGSIFFRGGCGRTVGGRRSSGSFVGFRGRPGERRGFGAGSGFDGFGSFGNSHGRRNGVYGSNGKNRNRSRGRFGDRSYGSSRGNDE